MLGVLFIILAILVIVGAVAKIVIIRLEKKPKKIQVFTAVVIIVGLLSAITYYFITERKEKQHALEGLLKPRASYESDEVIVYLGSSFVSIEKANLTKGIMLNPFKGFTMPGEIAIRYSKEGLLVSATIRSPDNKIVASIDRNNWSVNPGNYYRRNYDRSAVEVIDDYGTPVLQAEIFDYNKIRICGIFISDVAYAIVGTEIFAVGKGRVKEADTKKLLKQKGIEIRPWFVYEKGSLGKRTELGASLLKRYYKELSIRRTLRSSYSVLTNKELKAKALHYVEEIKDLIKNQWKRLYKEGTESSLELYKTRLRNTAIIIRNEILQRRPNWPKESAKLSVYEQPVNIQKIAEVAVDLENLAENLTREKWAKIDHMEKLKPLFSTNPEKANDLMYKHHYITDAETNAFLSKTRYSREDYEKLKLSYPEGRLLVFVSPNKQEALVDIPKNSMLKRDYYFNWPMLKINEINSEMISVTIRDFNIKNLVIGGILTIPINRKTSQPSLQVTILKLMIFTELLVDDTERILFVIGFKGFSGKIDTLMTLWDKRIQSGYTLIDGQNFKTALRTTKHP